MNTELKTNTDTLIAINNMLVSFYRPLDIEEPAPLFGFDIFLETQKATIPGNKAYVSIAADLIDKITKKTRSAIRKWGVSKNKKTKLTLKWHEALVLEKIITHSGYRANSYEQALLEKIAGDINQKFA